MLLPLFESLVANAGHGRLHSSCRCYCHRYRTCFCSNRLADNNKNKRDDDDDQ